jgi:hypothetical protein
MGWAYSAFLDQLVTDPDQDTASLAQSIVSSNIEKDTLIIDDRARAKYIEKVYETTDDISPAQLAAEEGKSVTLTAVDLSQIPQLLEAVNNLVQVMPGINQKNVARARSHSVAFENVFGDGKPPYIDLGHFVKLLKKESTSPKVSAAADQVRNAIKLAVLVEKHEDEKNGATGISIYFPASDLFESEGSDYESYVAIADRFAQESPWYDFLTFHYIGQPIAENYKPASKSKIIGQGKEQFKIETIELSADTSSMNTPFTLSSNVSGSQVAYMYIFTGAMMTSPGQ